MILPFKTKFDNGKPTEFVGKIWKGLIDNELAYFSTNELASASWFDYLYEAQELDPDNYKEWFGYWSSAIEDFSPKLHTIREDKKRLWYPGVKIHMVVFNRTKKRFQFAPVMECKAVQRIFMTDDNGFEVTVGNRYLMPFEIEALAVNDGFENAGAMEDYFFPKGHKLDSWSGKIIHWTDLKY